MPDRQYPKPRFDDEIDEAEARERAYAERRERSRAKVNAEFPQLTAYVRDVVERELGPVRIVGMIEDGKIIGRIAPDTLRAHEAANGGPLKRISADPDVKD
jgi:hypothetical protein